MNIHYYTTTLLSNLHRISCLILCLFAVVWTFIGCGTKTQSLAPRPDWIEKEPRDTEKYIYSVGVSSESRAKANEAARDELIKSLQIYVESKTYWEKQWRKFSDDEGFAEEMIEYRTEVYRGYLPRTTEIEYHREGNNHYTLVRLERDLLESMGERDQGLVRGAYNNAIGLAERGEVIPSLREFIRALSYAQLLLEGTPFDKMSLQKNRQTVLASQQIEIELKQLVNEIKLSQKGNNQRGEFGEALKNPLVVVAKKGELFVNGLPIQFYYQQGYGQLVDPFNKTGRSIEVETNRYGEAAVEVVQIQSIHPRNEVRAKINLLPLLDELPERAGGQRRLLQSIFESRESREVSFRYTSGFVLLKETIGVSMNEQSGHPVFHDGEEFTIKVEPPRKGFLHLFHINANGEIWFKGAVEVKYEKNFEYLRIRETPRGFEVTISNSTLKKSTDEPESEAIVVIAASKTVFSDQVRTTKKEVIDRFNRADPNNWMVGQVSYEVR